MSGKRRVWSAAEWLENLDEPGEVERTPSTEDQDTQLLQSQVCHAAVYAFCLHGQCDQCIQLAMNCLHSYLFFC